MLQTEAVAYRLAVGRELKKMEIPKGRFMRSTVTERMLLREIACATLETLYS
jgi:hypothetical protein